MNSFTRRGFLGGVALGAASFAVSAQAASPRLITLPGQITSGAAATIKGIVTARKVVAMTFDDGPHPTLTPILLDLLKSLNIRATFYLVGSRVAAYPQLVARIAAEGHEIGNHTWSHPYLTKRSASGVLRELDRTTRAVYEATGKAPVTMRPPYGALSLRQRLMVHQERNLPTILWSVDPQDWTRPAPGVVTQRILASTRAGGIVLSHDIHSQTIRAMPKTLAGLGAKGFEFVTVSEMLGWPRWQSRAFTLAPEA